MPDMLFAIRDRLQRWIVPELVYSQSSYEAVLRRISSGATAWLDVGCGHQILPRWREKAEAGLVVDVPLLVGVDYDLPALRVHRSIRELVRGDIARLPFADQSFDLVTANMVVEHLTQPELQFEEVFRVLRPGGVFLLHTPNLRSYVIQVARLLPESVKKALARVLEGRAAHDVFPTVYRANTDASLRTIAAAAGFDVAELHYTLTSPVFGRVPPLAALELCFIRQLSRNPSLHRFRQTLICLLQRPVTDRQ